MERREDCGVGASLAQKLELKRKFEKLGANSKKFRAIKAILQNSSKSQLKQHSTNQGHS